MKNALLRKSFTHLDPDVTDNAQNHDEMYSQVETDALPKKLLFKKFTVLCLLFSIFLYFMDMGLDISLAYTHYSSGNMIYFGMTVAFVILSTVTMTFFSLKWYIADYKKPGVPQVSPTMWAVRIVLHLFQLGIVLRYAESLRYGLMFRKTNKRKYYRWMVYEDADAAHLRIFEAFMESAPELLLKIYIFVQPDYNEDFFTVGRDAVSVASSLFSLAWAVVEQQRTTRISQPKKKNPRWTARAMQTVWYLFVTGSRMLALGLFASVFPVIFAIVCAAHWIVMTTWLSFIKTQFCDKKVEEFLYKCVLGVVFLFCYFNPVDTPTRWRYSFFYFTTFIENSVMISVWYNFVDPDLWFRLPALLTVFLSFFAGIAFMVIYYLVYHPNGPSKYCWSLISVSDDQVQDSDHGAIQLVTLGPVTADTTVPPSEMTSEENSFQVPSTTTCASNQTPGLTAQISQTEPKHS